MKKKPRLKIQFHPQWKGPIEGYTINAIRRIYPRVMGSHEFEDLLQESYIKFLQCQKCYQGKVNNPAWFMSLYKRALANQFNTILERVQRYSFIDCQDPSQILEPQSDVNPESEIDVMRVLKELPEEFVEVLKGMSEVTEISETLMACVKERDFRSKNVQALRAYLCQQLGLEQ